MISARALRGAKMLGWSAVLLLAGGPLLGLLFGSVMIAAPAFGFGAIHLWLETVEEGWRVAVILEADLVTLLRDSCAGVQRIVHPFAANGVGKEPASVDRWDFLRALSDERSIERLVGPQAQVPDPPYIGLWMRLWGFRLERSGR